MDAFLYFIGIGVMIFLIYLGNALDNYFGNKNKPNDQTNKPHK